MTVPQSSTGLPPPHTDDDDDVAWALQTAQVQWQRGAHADAVVWLRRAIESAREIGAMDRASELEHATHEIVERLMAVSYTQPAARAQAEPQAPDVDDLLDAIDAEEAPVDSATPVSIDDDLVEEVDDTIELEEVEELEDVELVDERMPSAEELEEASELEDSAPELASDAPFSAGGFQVQNLMDIGFAPGEALEERTFVDQPRQARDFDEIDFDEDESPTRPAQPVDAALSFEAEPPAVESPRAHALRMARARVAQVAERAARSVPPRAPEPPRPVPVRDDLDEHTPLYVPRSERPVNLPPVRAETASSSAETPEPALVEVPAAPVSVSTPAEPKVGEVLLADVHGLQDLPPEAQAELARKARIERLDTEQEVSSFGLALVLRGRVAVMPTVLDIACAQVPANSVVFSRGHLQSGVLLRLVAQEDGTEVAVWDSEALETAFEDCPWVADELRTIADRYQALAGLGMGALGERLDDMMRAMVTERCEVRLLLPGEEIVTRDKPMPGMFIVGGGQIEIFASDDETPSDTLGSGDFVLPAHVLSGGKAQASARAGQGGALVLFAGRMVAHELLVSVPPLLEVLAS